MTTQHDDPQVDVTHDPQLDTSSSAQLYEVLIEAPNGHRTVRRYVASNADVAGSAVEAGFEVLGVAPAGAGLGSGDPSDSTSARAPRADAVRGGQPIETR